MLWYFLVWESSNVLDVPIIKCEPAYCIEQTVYVDNTYVVQGVRAVDSTAVAQSFQRTCSRRYENFFLGFLD